MRLAAAFGVHAPFQVGVGRDAGRFLIQALLVGAELLSLSQVLAQVLDHEVVDGVSGEELSLSEGPTVKRLREPAARLHPRELPTPTPRMNPHDPQRHAEWAYNEHEAHHYDHREVVFGRLLDLLIRRRRPWWLSRRWIWRQKRRRSRGRWCRGRSQGHRSERPPCNVNADGDGTARRPRARCWRNCKFA